MVTHSAPWMMARSPTGSRPPEPQGAGFLSASAALRPQLVCVAVAFNLVFVILGNFSNLPGMLIEAAVVLMGLLAMKRPLFWILPCVLEVLLLLDGDLTASSGFLILMPALVDLSASGHLRVSWMTVASAHLVFVLSAVAYPQVPWSTYVFLGFLLITAVCSGTWVYTNAIRRSADKLAFQQRRRDERVELARTIHDTLAAQLSHVVLLSRSMDRELPPEFHARNLRIQEEAQQGLTDLRWLVGMLRDDLGPLPETGRTGLSRTWQEVVGLLMDSEFTPVANYQVTQVVTNPDTERLACRCLREITGNIIRHAPHGSVVQLDITTNDQSLTITSSNPEPHPDTPARFPTSGYGLTGMRERLGAMRGILRTSQVDNTWIVFVRIPLAPGTAIT